ncbi:MAG: winged helix-turn-helix domain-containing protein [Actinobacteria bacterium]|nr:winged helix-turn-helix domain-containing protein [Actinomycetota bacterium]
MEQNEVNEAFEILLEEIEEVANDLTYTGAEAFHTGDYEKANKAIEEATRLSDFREKVRALQKEWGTLLVAQPVRRSKISKKQSAVKLRRGLRTAEDAFREPLLATLVELGGSAPVGEVLDRIEKKMKGVLNEYDYQPLASNPNSVRWRNTAQWCRNTLVREGLMKSDSPHGIWEISDLGKDRVG